MHSMTGGTQRQMSEFACVARTTRCRIAYFSWSSPVLHAPLAVVLHISVGVRLCCTHHSLSYCIFQLEFACVARTTRCRIAYFSWSSPVLHAPLAVVLHISVGVRLCCTHHSLSYCIFQLVPVKLDETCFPCTKG